MIQVSVNTVSSGPSSQPSKGEDNSDMALLPEVFAPTVWDVVCGRGRKCFNHAGNERLRDVVAGYLEQYSSANSKLEKSYILSDIVAKVRKDSPDGGFVKRCPETNRWYEVGDFLAREKTSQAFRDALHDKYKSSNSAKKKRRQVARAVKFEKAFSTSDLGYDAKSEPLDGPLDAYSSQGSSKFRRVELTRASSFSQQGDDAMLGDLSEFDGKAVRRGLSHPSSQGSQHSVVDVRRPAFSSNKREPSFNHSCPNFSFDPASLQEDEPNENSHWEDNSDSYSENFGPADQTPPNPMLMAAKPNPFQNTARPNMFLVSKPYYSNSSSSLMSVEESVDETMEEFNTGFGQPDPENDLSLNDLIVPVILDGGLLASLSNLMDDMPIHGNPYEPVPLPDM